MLVYIQHFLFQIEFFFFWYTDLLCVGNFADWVSAPFIIISGINNKQFETLACIIKYYKAKSAKYKANNMNDIRGHYEPENKGYILHKMRNVALIIT